MSARLLRKTGIDQGEYPITGETTIGRHPDNTISVGRDAISGKHARIRFDPVRGCYLLEDLGSRNGTRLDGERIQGTEALGHLHVITFADTDFIFQDLQLTALRQGRQLSASEEGTGPPPASTSRHYAPAEQIPESERTLFDVGPPMLPPIVPPILAGGPIGAPVPSGDAASDDERERTEFEALPMALPSALVADKAPSAAAVSAQEHAAQEPIAAPCFLVLTDSDQPSRRFRLHFGENLIGRGNEAGVQLESLNLSRRHATLTIGDGVLYLRDEGSRNHTYVNDVQIEGTVEIPLSSRLRFGAVEGWLLPIAEPSA